MGERQKETILELKRLRREQGLTYQDIVSQCEANGEAVSLSTVKRVFGRGGEDDSFRVTTIEAIEKVLRGPDAPGAIGQELFTALVWYRAALFAARRRERAMVFAMVVLAVALYGMIDYFVFPTSLLFRPGL